MSACEAIYYQPASTSSAPAFSKGYFAPYLVVVIKYKTTYSAFAPDVPGCVAAAEDLASVRQLITEALALHLEGVLEDGDELPAPKTLLFTEQLDKEEELVEQGLVRLLVRAACGSES